MWSMLGVDMSSITEATPRLPRGPLRVVGAFLGLGAKGMRIENMAHVFSKGRTVRQTQTKYWEAC